MMLWEAFKKINMCPLSAGRGDSRGSRHGKSWGKACVSLFSWIGVYCLKISCTPRTGRDGLKVTAFVLTLWILLCPVFGRGTDFQRSLLTQVSRSSFVRAGLSQEKGDFRKAAADFELALQAGLLLEDR